MSDEFLPNPKSGANPEELEHLVRDFEERTLAGMEGQFSRLVYLASLRDYNTGRYHHYGLESRYALEAVDEGLHHCHVRVFEELRSNSADWSIWHHCATTTPGAITIMDWSHVMRWKQWTKACTIATCGFLKNSDLIQPIGLSGITARLQHRALSPLWIGVTLCAGSSGRRPAPLPRAGF